MGFLEQIRLGLGTPADATLYAGGTVGGIPAEVSPGFLRTVTRLRDGFPAGDVSAAGELYRQTRELNDEIIELELRRIRDRTPGPDGSRQLRELYGQRELLKRRLQESAELELIGSWRQSPGSSDLLQVIDSTAHLLQFHVGRTVFGRSCGSCGAPVTLQWKPGLPELRTADFFWGCSGGHGRMPHYELLTPADRTLFTGIDRPEFLLSGTELERVLTRPANRQEVVRRLGAVMGQETGVYLCPVHNEPMVLRERQGTPRLLDRFFLSCPRWRATIGDCSRVVRLTSAAQLASTLEAFTGGGII